VLSWLTAAIVTVALLVLLLSGLYAWRNRPMDDWLLGILALCLVGTLVQAVVAVVRVASLADERATFLAYALTLPFIPPLVAFLAIKEKSRWAMGSIAVGAFAVAVMTARLQQIWGMHA
jgi:hypothetical protein